MKNIFKRGRAALLLLISSILFNYNCTNMDKNTSQQQMIKDYYAAYEKKDWSLLESILDKEFTFTSPAGDDHIDLNLYKERCWPNANNTKKFDIEKIIIDGNAGYITYNGWTTGGKLFRNTERFKFKDGKIIELECFFGTGISFPNNDNAVK